jgi:hypothetical protein
MRYLRFVHLTCLMLVFASVTDRMVAQAASIPGSARDIADMLAACVDPNEAFITMNLGPGLTRTDILDAITTNYTALAAKSKEEIAAAAATVRTEFQDSDESYAATICGAKRRLAQVEGKVTSADLGTGLSPADSMVFFLPGEYYSRTKDNCGLLWRPSAAIIQRGDTAIANRRRSLTNGRYPGVACAGGFLHGDMADSVVDSRGTTVVVFRAHYVYGRALGPSESNFVRPPGERVVRYQVQTDSGAIRFATLPNTPAPFLPLWGLPGKEVFTTLLGDDGAAASTVKADCLTAARTLMGTDTSGHGPDAHFPGCNAADRFLVFGVAFRPRGAVTWQPVWCPNPRTSEGCADVWSTTAGPVIARMKVFIAEAEAFVATERVRYTERWRALQARRAAGELAARKQELRAAELEAAKAAAADRAFRAMLVGKNAGQLYAMADKFNEAGQRTEAREVLRTLIARFPSHALAPTAAKMLADIKEIPE